MLTAAERRVADLFATGRTNAEIAAELFIGQRTVEAHMSRVYHKLRVRSRTELCRILLSPPSRASRVFRRGQTCGIYGFVRAMSGHNVAL